ncbi:hypothetical protein NIES37_01130 [Tolypothrix tenuis PCC 7101]|uniref:PqqC-like protein n=1 Tax=Tolypothrix tenuis PCC 7101 TaxID=231146 RepID=A0A1Z4MRT9_9CYAN|nr:hypothetical protein [Aulosira sp. FACHB-113]BAY96186.1 hypothetical protein NIES37_01130 [Tolypothrix tenuis PCC 7101]BAZ73307.1 hypothetical protein NIES50_18710 [Aulosira laxa NIES-50]
MKEVLELIQNKKQEFSELPLFKFMQDRSIDPIKRLSWTPYFAPIAMGFTDLNKYIFRKEPTDNKIQKIINQNTYEEETHYLWFLEDLAALGFDHSQKFSDSLKFIWADEGMKNTRLTCLQTALLTYQADPVVVLAVIEVIEATEDIIFTHTTRITEELKEITNQKYIFFGKTHSDAVEFHTMKTDEMEQFIESIKLTQEQKDKACEAVLKEFEIVTELVNEMMAYAEKALLEQAGLVA